MHIQMMEALVLFVLVCVGHSSAKHEAENDKRAESEAFETNKIQLSGGEELLVVTAADGKPLATIDVVLAEGYEIELTPDGSKCRLSLVRDNSSCFDEVPFDEDTLEYHELDSVRIADRCKGREIVTLKPVDCDANSGLNGDKRFGKRWTCWSTAYRNVCKSGGWWWGAYHHCETHEYQISHC